MSRPAGLAGYGFGFLLFTYFLDSEAGVDFLNVGYFDPAVGLVYTSFTGTGFSWTTDAIPVPSTATEVVFWFTSDGAGIAEGAYVDDVVMYGQLATTIWSEDFEGAFPGSAWTVQDMNPSAGDDYWGATGVRAFGSRVTGKVKPFSDLDLAVMGSEPLPASILADLKDAFSESDLPFKVDIVDWAETQDNFRSIIEAAYVVVQSGKRRVLNTEG